MAELKIPCVFDNTKNCPPECRFHRITERSIKDAAQLINASVEDMVTALRIAPRDEVRAKATNALKSAPLSMTFCKHSRESIKQ